MDIRRVKPNLQKQVLYSGKVYTMLEYVLWLDTLSKQSKVRHSLVLQDKRGNSTIRVPLDKVQEINEGENNNDRETV